MRIGSRAASLLPVLTWSLGGPLSEAWPAHGQAVSDHLDPPPALSPGLMIGQTLHAPAGLGGCTAESCDRESLVSVAEVSPQAVAYVWEYIEWHTGQDTVREKVVTEVSPADLARAERWRDYVGGSGDEVQRYPGYTTFTISTALYDRLRAEGTAPYAVMSLEDKDLPGPVAALSRARPTPVLWRGTLTRLSAAPEPFPMIVDGRRVTVPALRLEGRFTATRQRRWEPDIWVLADREHPLFLKVAVGEHVWQTVRIDTGAGEVDGVPEALEGALARDCRVELPGIYFGFNSAELYAASEPAIAAFAEILGRHPAWMGTVEGHTDDVGTEGFNRTLSERRAAAVLDRLVTAHGIEPGRLRTVGHGESTPRESNETIEGRARNRRVEFARDCATGVDAS